MAKETKPPFSIKYQGPHVNSQGSGHSSRCFKLLKIIRMPLVLCHYVSKGNLLFKNSFFSDAASFIGIIFLPGSYDIWSYSFRCTDTPCRAADGYLWGENKPPLCSMWLLLKPTKMSALTSHSTALPPCPTLTDCFKWKLFHNLSSGKYSYFL